MSVRADGAGTSELGLLGWLGLGETERQAAFLPLATRLEQLHALEALEDIAAGTDAGGSF